MKNILIVDDNAIVRRTLRAFLERDGCLVREAGAGDEALSLLASHQFDLMFLDLHMPRVDGLGVLRALGEVKVPVVLITSSEATSEIVAAYKLGAHDYLIKPFRQEQVRRALERATGFDPRSVHRSTMSVALFDRDEELAQVLRGALDERDELHHVDTMQGVPDCLTRAHQLVLVGNLGAKCDAEAEEAEAIGDLVTQRDASALLVRVLPDGQHLPDATLFHAAVERNDPASLATVLRVCQSATVLVSGRRIRALRCEGPASLHHVYWWALRRTLDAQVRQTFLAGATALTIDLSLAPDLGSELDPLTTALEELVEQLMGEVQFIRPGGPPAAPTRESMLAATLPPQHPTPLPTRDAPPAPLSAELRASVSPASNELLVVPGFDVGALLGEGGMSRVFRATQLSLRRQVCIKVLRDEVASEPSIASRFTDEGIALATLRHPNIVSVLDVGRATAGQLFMVMEFVEGGDLRQHLSRVRTLELAEAVTLVSQVLSGLAEAHAHGIIHRDIKPSNILRTVLKDGTALAKVVDFGIARLLEGTRTTGQTRMGTVIGTPGYMAPEQMMGLEISEATDLYAVGAVLFEVLSGRRAFVARDEFEFAQLMMVAPAPRIEAVSGRAVPARVEALVAALLEKNPRNRPASAAEVRAELLAVTSLKAA